MTVTMIYRHTPRLWHRLLLALPRAVPPRYTRISSKSLLVATLAPYSTGFGPAPKLSPGVSEQNNDKLYDVFRGPRRTVPVAQTSVLDSTPMPPTCVRARSPLAKRITMSEATGGEEYGSRAHRANHVIYYHLWGRLNVWERQSDKIWHESQISPNQLGVFIVLPAS
jgi:hypothetical protein